MLPSTNMLRRFVKLFTLGLLAALLIPTASPPIRADQQTYALAPDENLIITCPTRLVGSITGPHSTLTCAPLEPTGVAQPSATAQPPASSTATAAPLPQPATTGFRGVQEGQILSGTARIELVVVEPNVKQVAFQLSGPKTAANTERAAPYAFFGDVNGQLIGWDTTSYPDGEYTLTATITDTAGKSRSLAVHFRVANSSIQPTPATTPSVEPTGTAAPSPQPGATTDPADGPRITDLRGVQEGQILSGTVGIEALVEGSGIARVAFELSGPKTAANTEKAAPYFFLGDRDGQPLGWNTTQYPDGEYTLKATVTDTAGRSSTKSVHFRVANGVSVPPTVVPTVTATAAPSPAPAPSPVPPQPGKGVLAFPGAEGFGAVAVGGRGGKVLVVDNLQDYRPGATPIPGTLRWALSQEGPRIIIFRRGGVIKAVAEMTIDHPYVTIAGQTAPGDGITIQNRTLTVRTHDVIIRGLRVRVGDQQPGTDSIDADAMKATTSGGTQNVYNIIFDHCSLSWAQDETFSTYQSPIKPYTLRDVTIQWSILSEGLRYSRHSKRDRVHHSMGLIVADRSQRVSIHHNLFAHNIDRNPLVQGGTTSEIINNVVYNWGSAGTKVENSNNYSQPIMTNIIGNYYKPGIGSGNSKGIIVRDFSGRPMPGGSRVYVSGNIGPGREKGIGDDWLAVSGSAARVNTPAVQPSNVRVDDARTAYDKVLAYAGALAPQRDEVDARIARETDSADAQNSFRGTAGKFIDKPSYPSFNNPANNNPPADADNDGLPDDFERAHASGSATALAPNDTAPSGYTWIEEYINSLLPAHQ